jgi:hypothetical protein
MFVGICLSVNAQKSKPIDNYSYLSSVQQIIQREALICMSQGLGQNRTMISKYDELKKLNDSLSFISKYNGGGILKKDSILINQYFIGIDSFGQTNSDFLKWSDLSLKIGLYNNSLTFIQSRVFDMKLIFQDNMNI